MRTQKVFPLDNDAPSNEQKLLNGADMRPTFDGQPLCLGSIGVPQRKRPQGETEHIQRRSERITYAHAMAYVLKDAREEDGGEQVRSRNNCRDFVAKKPAKRPAVELNGGRRWPRAGSDVAGTRGAGQRMRWTGRDAVRGEGDGFATARAWKLCVGEESERKQ